MKKWIVGALLLMLALLVGAWALADGETVPAEIQEHLTLVLRDGYSLAGYGELSGEGWAFALLQGDQGHNMLYVYQRQDGKWVNWLQTDRVVFQGTKEIGLIVTPNGSEHDFITETQNVSWPVVNIFQANAAADDPEKEYPERFIEFGLRKGQWLLTYWEDFDNDCAARIKDDELRYYHSWLGDYRFYGAVQGTMQRDIRYTAISIIPHSYKAAVQGITVAPTIPAGTLAAQSIEFTGGKKYAVYSGPGENYTRGANGKAAVSTNDWIQVFGRENGWIMVQYAIDKDHYRIGYISEKSLPKGVWVDALGFQPQTVYLRNAVYVTDDPLFSGASVGSLQEGQAVSLLGSMGDWAYIEASDGTPFRGFVPQSAITTESSAFATYVSPEGVIYNRFCINRLLMDGNNRVYAVHGYFEREVMGEESVQPDMAKGSERTYALAADFHADMVSSMTGEAETLISVTDLYAWYLKAYLDVDSLGDRDMIFAIDLTDEQMEIITPDFWFVTTQIQLNDQNEIQYMRYVYVPWA